MSIDDLSSFAIAAAFLALAAFFAPILRATVLTNLLGWLTFTTTAVSYAYDAWQVGPHDTFLVSLHVVQALLIPVFLLSFLADVRRRCILGLSDPQNARRDFTTEQARQAVRAEIREQVDHLNDSLAQAMDRADARDDADRERECREDDRRGRGNAAR